MKRFLFTCWTLFLLVSSTLASDIDGGSEPLQAEETIGTYSGALGSLHSAYNPASIGASLGSYDDYHKYGGIGKKAHLSSLYDHGSKGYKNYYGDSGYGNQGLNKYTKHHQSDHYGGKSSAHSDYHDGHVYTRNRGYGYEKHYMYDKEYSTAKKGGHHEDQSSYYGDHDKGSKMTLDSYKKYGHKKYGGKSGHDDHSYGKYSHLVDDHGDHYLKHNGGHHKHLEHLMDDQYRHPLPTTYVTHQDSYVPVIESYGGALGHSSHTPTYSDYGSGSLLSHNHHHLPSSASVVYVPSASTSSSSTEGESVNTLSAKAAAAAISPPAHTSSSSSSPSLISTKLTPVTSDGSPALYSASILANGQRVNSAVHATPAVINTSNGVHYYSS